MKLFRKIRGKFGFTLAEMLIVVAILAILTAVAAPNVAKYSRSINLRELNDSARAIYMAAEHKFMNEIEMGRTLPEGADVDKSALKSRYGDDASAVNVKYLKSESTDLQKLMTSGSAAGDSTGVIESQLYDNNYIVEYNPETGDVFGVFYSEDDDLSGYEANCYPDIAEMQKEKLIGYYGSDNVKPEEKTNSEVLPKPEVEIINKEKLVVKINTESTENQYVTISVNGKEIIKRNNIYMNGSVEIILDSLTPGTPGKANLPSENGQLQSKYEDTIANWLNETGLTIDGSDMTLTVTFYDKDGKTRDQSVTKTFNPLFANGSTADTAYIEYGRHLQNLDKCSAINTAVIKKTINFASTAGNYEGWESTYPDGGSYKTFVALAQNNLTEIYAVSGAEIKNIVVKTASDADIISGFANGCGLFEVVDSMYFHDLRFINPVIDCKELGAGVVCGISRKGSRFENITVVNPTVKSSSVGSACGALAGYVNANSLLSMPELLLEDKREEVKNCAVYISSDGDWSDPNNDPYSIYGIEDNGERSYAGGLIGAAAALTCEKSYAAVRVKGGGAAGGIIGYYSNIGTNEPLELTDCFVAGHTYEGKFEGKFVLNEVEKGFDLKKNISSDGDSGGLVGTLLGAKIKISREVFSTCSVLAYEDPDPHVDANADTAWVSASNKADVIISTGATVYTLGTAYKDNGDGTFTEIKKSADTNVKTGDDVKVDDSSAAVGKRYDLKVSSVYKYPVPTGMTMHGDWPSSDAVTGFFYWEKEGSNYHIQALWYGNGKPDELKTPAASQLRKEQDGSNITAYGYGAFSVGGSLDNLVEFKDATGAKLADGAIKPLEETSASSIVDEIRKILKESDDLKDKISKDEDIKINIYSGIDVGKGLVTATVSGNDYKFAPDFYAIYAVDSTDSTKKAGTDPDTYGVRCKNHLQNVANALSGNFVQSHDINYKDDTTGLTPIGDSTNKFTGAYDGGSYRIINAKINSIDTTDYAGLFGVTDGAQLENIVMFVEAATAENFAEIKGKTVGGLVAKSTDGTISNCVVSGYTITGDTASGGIVGDSTGTKIETCEANVKLSGDGNVGGIAGSADSTSTIDNCYALVHGYDGKADETLGGIAGKATTVTNCYVIFSGQISGYPVANISVTGTDYYVKEKGYYQGNPKLGNYGQKQTYNQLKATEQKEDNQISYSEKATENDKKYEFKALVEDNVKHVPVHYGPTPPKAELDAETLTEGPLVGIFNVQDYYVGNSSEYDGLIAYNRSGVLNWDEKVPSDAQGSRHVGIILANPEDEYVKSNSYLILEDGIKSEHLSVYVNGVKVVPTRFKEFGKTAGTGQSRGGYYYCGYSTVPDEKYSDENRQKGIWISDSFQLKGNPGADINKQFMLYVILDESEQEEMKPEDINSIEIRYDNPDTKIKGYLLKSEKEKKSLNDTDHMAYIPGSIVDEWETPVMGAFIAGANLSGLRDKNLPKYIYPYSMKLTRTIEGITTTVGDAYHYYDNGVLGVIIRSDQAEEILNGNIKFQVNSMPVDMVPWDEQMNVDICNSSALGLDGYEIFVVKEGEITPEEISWGWPDFTAVYGSKLVFKYKCNVLTSETSNKTAEEYMPDFVLATLYANTTGSHYAKGYKSGANIYPEQSVGRSSNNDSTIKTNSYVFLTTGLTKDFTIKINGNKFVDIGEETDMVTNLTWDFSGKAYTINILGDEVNSIEVYYKGELIMSKEASEF